MLGRPTSAARACLSLPHRSRPVPSQCWPWADQGVPLLRNRAQRTRFGLGASDEAARGGGVILRWSAVHSRWSSRDALVQCDLPSHRRSSSANRAGGERSPAETHRANRSIRTPRPPPRRAIRLHPKPGTNAPPQIARKQHSRLQRMNPSPRSEE
jgi:hypothetical protein